jgi:DNA primase
LSDDFKLLIEQVKAHSPIEDVVRERVPTLRRAGALWVACCPFHEEKTPSFKVDPRRGTWNCYGACGTGGDQLSFVQRAYNVEFREALEILAGRAGIALPERGARDGTSKEQYDELYGVLERAEKFYRGWLRRPEGARAFAYVRDRGLSDATIDAFGVGFAPAGGRELVSRAVAQGLAIDKLVAVGLARTDAEGRAYDFFQGRLMIPVRDIKGRTIGFGARRLSDEDKRSPKYVNTSETALFHKGRVIYALDCALEHVRKHGHLVLVEGYTDVMAAHQVGLRGFVAVLGTATTEEHAALVRRTGARRVSLLFDADDAGRKATWRALEGLLALEVPIDVVRLVGDKDPCELVMREGVASLEAQLASAVPWFDFLVEGLLSHNGAERWREVDHVFALLARIPKPLVRDEYLVRLARALDTPIEGVRAQFQTLPERRREAERRSRAAQVETPVAAPVDPRSARLRDAFADVAGAMLLEPDLAQRAAELSRACPDPSLRRLLEVLADLHARHAGAFTLDAVFAALDDEPIRDLVVPLVESASVAARPRDELFECSANLIRDQLLAAEQTSRIAACWEQPVGSESYKREILELHQVMRARMK